MGQLKDLLQKDVKELSPAELEERLNVLKSLKVSAGKKKATSTGEIKLRQPKTNKQKRIEDKLKSLTPAQLAAVRKALEGNNG